MHKLIFLYLLCFPLLLSAQQIDKRRPFHYQYEFREQDTFYQNSKTLNLKRKRTTNRLLAAGYTSIGLYLGIVWYGGEELSKFHFFDDSHEWKQMDKVGHVMGTYQVSRNVIALSKWSGVPKGKAIVGGALSGFLAMSTIEVLDGFGEKWGFSWSDLGANFIGSGIAFGNQSLWNEERLQLKLSYIRSPYTKDPEFYRLFGSSLPEWFLKDYNGQAYWLSVRVHSFLPEGKFKEKYPRWLNLAVGYGAEGLEGGYHEPDGSWRTREYRQLYLSLDIDMANIRTRSGLLKRVFGFINILRIPLPALQIDRQGLQFVPFR